MSSRASRARVAATEVEADAPSFRRQADVPGAPKVSTNARTAKTELPKEAIPGANSVLAAMGVRGEYAGALTVSVYTKHESTETVLKRLGLTFNGTVQRNEAVVKALTMNDHEREYNRLGDSDRPETVGITWAGVKSAWPFPNVPPMKQDYKAWELVDAGCVPTRVKAAAEQCEQRICEAYDDAGQVIPLDERTQA